jgi:site-specific DNA-methyltransferase (adenine-specific)
MRVEVIGDATLYLADCMEVLPTLGKVDAVITDPPYGIGLTKKTSDFRGSQFFDNGESLKASILYDDSPEVVGAMVREMMPGLLGMADRAVIFCGPSMLFNYPKPAAIGAVFTVNGAGRCAWGFQCVHPILFYGKDPFLQDGKGGRPNSIRDEQPNREVVDHPCPKPLGWMNWAVWRGSRVGEVVLDPFMGSGTTGVAALQLGRKFIGIEREEKYFDIACRRIDDAMKQDQLFNAAEWEAPEQITMFSKGD